MTPDSPELERRVHALLRALPERAAPASLEDRVLAELARRGSLPWWRRSYAAWPMAARAAFVVAAVGCGAVLAGMLGLSCGPAATALVARLEWLDAFRLLAADARGLLEPVSVGWLYGIAAACAAGYAFLARMGVAAYRAYAAGRLLPRTLRP